MTLNPPNSPVNGEVYTDPTSGQSWMFNTSIGTSGAWESMPMPMGGLPAGSIIQWAGSVAPSNWFFADGAAVSRTTYASLFAAIGTTYGAGDGSTTFNLPDLRGRVPVGKNAGTFSTLGATGGAESVTLTSAQSGLPAHTHGVSWLNNINVAPFSGSYGAIGSNAAGNVNANAAQDAAQAHTNLQPYLVTNYIIKASSGWTAGDSELATRVGSLEAAPAGLVRVVPTSVAVGSGSASVSSTGVVTFTGVSSISIYGVLSTIHQDFNSMLSYNGSVSGDVYFRWLNGTTEVQSGYYGASQYWSYNTAPVYIWTASGANVSNFGHNGTLNNVNEAKLSPRNAYSIMRFENYSADIAALYSGGYNTTTSTRPDGFKISTSTGTISGTIQVYGYRN